jgi:hypothetical protein
MDVGGGAGEPAQVKRLWHARLRAPHAPASSCNVAQSGSAASSLSTRKTRSAPTFGCLCPRSARAAMSLRLVRVVTPERCLRAVGIRSSAPSRCRRPESPRHSGTRRGRRGGTRSPRRPPRVHRHAVAERADPPAATPPARRCSAVARPIPCAAPVTTALASGIERRYFGRGHEERPLAPGHHEALRYRAVVRRPSRRVHRGGDVREQSVLA